MAEKNCPIKVFYSIFFTPPRWADAAFVRRRPARLRGRPAKPHTSAQRAPRRGANGCADVRFWLVPQFSRWSSAHRRHLGQGSPCKLPFGTKRRCLRASSRTALLRDDFLCCASKSHLSSASSLLLSKMQTVLFVPVFLQCRQAPHPVHGPRLYRPAMCCGIARFWRLPQSFPTSGPSQAHFHIMSTGL